MSTYHHTISDSSGGRSSPTSTPLNNHSKKGTKKDDDDDDDLDILSSSSKGPNDDLDLFDATPPLSGLPGPPLVDTQGACVDAWLNGTCGTLAYFGLACATKVGR